MSVQRRWTERTDEARAALDRLCVGWCADASVRVAKDIPAITRETAQNETLKHLRECVLPHPGSGLLSLTDGFLDDGLRNDNLLREVTLTKKEREDPEMKLAVALSHRFPEFVAALFCFYLLRSAATDVHRRKAAQLLLASLRTPLERAVRTRPNRVSETVFEEAFARLGETPAGDDNTPLLRSWTRQPPDSFSHALGYATKTMNNAVVDVQRRKQPQIGSLVFDGSSEPHADSDDDGPIRIERRNEMFRVFGPDLEDNLFQLGCRVAWAYRPHNGLQLLLWLMLAGIYPRKTKERGPFHEIPFRLEKNLIEAVKISIDKNYMRSLEPTVSRLMREQGLAEVLRRAVEQEIRAAKKLLGEEWRPTPESFTAYECPDPWEVYLVICARSALMRDRGELSPTAPVVPGGVPGSSVSAMDLLRWVKGQSADNPPARAEVVWFSDELCNLNKTMEDWSKFLRTIEEART